MKSSDVVKALCALAQESRLAVFRLLVKRGPEGFTPSVIADKLGIAAAAPYKPSNHISGDASGNDLIRLIRSTPTVTFASIDCHVLVTINTHAKASQAQNINPPRVAS